MKKGPPRLDITGVSSGKLTAVRFSHKRGTVNMWLFHCSCGNSKIAPVAEFNRGRVRSCGCLAAERAVEVHKKHGMSHAPEYIAYWAMRTRCSSDLHGKYHKALGVTVCRRWLDSFEDFYADVGPRPSPKHSLDRYPNPFGNYEPGNVRWATARQQQENRRDRVA